MDQSEGPPDLNAPQATFACDGVNQVARVVDAVTSDSDDTASATAARAAIEDQRSPSPTSVRTQDFLNFYPPTLPPAADPLAVTLELRPSLVSGYYDLAVMLQAAADSSARPPLTAVALVDVSGLDQLMLDRAKTTIAALSGELTSADSLTVLTTDPSSPPLELQNDLTLLDTLTTSSAGDLADGLVRAYDAAAMHAVDGSVQRVFLIGAGAGDPQDLDADAIDYHATVESVRLHAVGVGSAESSRQLRAAARNGRGAYAWVGGGADIDRVIAARFEAFFRIAYTDVRLNLILPWYFSVVAPASEQTVAAATAPPQSMAPGDVMVFPFKIAACDAAAVDPASLVDVSVSATDTKDGQRKTVELSKALSEIKASDHLALSKVMAVYGYAEALKTLDPVRLEAAQTSAWDAYSLTQDHDLEDIANLIGLHPALATP